MKTLHTLGFPAVTTAAWVVGSVAIVEERSGFLGSYSHKGKVTGKPGHLGAVSILWSTSLS